MTVVVRSRLSLSSEMFSIARGDRTHDVEDLVARVVAHDHAVAEPCATCWSLDRLTFSTSAEPVRNRADSPAR